MILQEHLEKEDEVLVSLAGLKQVSVSYAPVHTPSVAVDGFVIIIAVVPVRSKTS